MRSLLPLCIAAVIVPGAAHADAPLAGHEAQAVVDLEARTEAAVDASDRRELEARATEAAQTWLRRELELARARPDPQQALRSVQSVIHEANRRGLKRIVDAGQAAEVELVRRREPAYLALVQAGRLLPALELARREISVALEGAPARDRMQVVVAAVNARIDAAEAAATTREMRELHAQMRRWTGTPTPPVAALAAPTLLAWNVVAEVASCANARPSLSPVSTPGGAPVTVRYALTSCPVQTSISSVQRTHTWHRSETQSRMVTVYRKEKQTREIRGSKQVCSQVKKPFGCNAHGVCDSITVSECKDVPTTSYETVEVDVPEQVEKKEVVSIPMSEPYTVQLRSGVTATTVSVTIDGAGHTASASRSVSAQANDEQYTLQHGASQAFSPTFEHDTQRLLAEQVAATIRGTVEDWERQRASERMRAARAAVGEAALAQTLLAIALGAPASEWAATFEPFGLTSAEVHELVSGRATARLLTLDTAAAFEMPSASTSVTRAIARERDLRAELALKRGGMATAGLGTARVPYTDATGRHHAWAFDLDLHMGMTLGTRFAYARASGELQSLFSSTVVHVDVNARLEAGLRLGPLTLGAVGVLGISGGKREETDWARRATYAGYGARAQLLVSKLGVEVVGLHQPDAGGEQPAGSRAEAQLFWAAVPGSRLYLKTRINSSSGLRDVLAADEKLVAVTLGAGLDY